MLLHEQCSYNTCHKKNRKNDSELEEESFESPPRMKSDIAPTSAERLTQTSARALEKDGRYEKAREADMDVGQDSRCNLHVKPIIARDPKLGKSRENPLIWRLTSVLSPGILEPLDA